MEELCELLALEAEAIARDIRNTMQDFIEQNTAYQWAKALEQAYGREGTE